MYTVLSNRITVSIGLCGRRVQEKNRSYFGGVEALVVKL